MKIMLDTNVLISALIFGGIPRQLIGKLLLLGHDINISDYVESELLDKIHMKWPQKEENLRKVYQKMNFIHCSSTNEKLGDVRDEKDIPVLSDAIYNNVDILLTGDKDFLESEIKHPIIFSPKMLMDYLSKNNIDNHNVK